MVFCPTNLKWWVWEFQPQKWWFYANYSTAIHVTNSYTNKMNTKTGEYGLALLPEEDVVGNAELLWLEQEVMAAALDGGRRGRGTAT